MLASLRLQSSSGVFLSMVVVLLGPLLFIVPVMQSSPISVGDDVCMESQQRDKPRGSGC